LDVVDELLAQRFSLGFYVSRIQAELVDHGQDLPALIKTSRDAILVGRAESLGRYLRDRVKDPAAIDRALQIANVAIEVARLWKN